MIAPQSYFNLDYFPFAGNPFMYKRGPEHLFFNYKPQPPVVSDTTKNSVAPVESVYPRGPLEQVMSGGPNETFNDAVGEFGPRDSAMYEARGPHAGWVGGAIPGIAGFFGGPVIGGLAGFAMGLAAHNALANELAKHGIDISKEPNMPTAFETALSAAARGITGFLGSLLGFGKTADEVAERAAELANRSRSVQEVEREDLPDLTDTVKENNEETQNDDSIDDTANNVDVSDTNDESDSDSDSASDSNGGGGGEGGAEADHLAKGGRVVVGPGGGLDDLIPATIDGRRLARLSDGEFVIPADVVSMLGDGSSKAGAQRLYNFIRMVREQKTNSPKQAPPLQFDKIVKEILR